MNVSQFISRLPHRPYCGDDLSRGIFTTHRECAIEHRIIQANSTNQVRWLTFDVDREGSWYAWEDGRLPYPSFIATNPNNGHAHIAYELEAPVTISSSAHSAPIELLKTVQRGFTRRLQSDVGYSGFLCKNPFHPQWLTDWIAKRPYDLFRLFDSLNPEDMRPYRGIRPTGYGRNCTIFDELRKIAYHSVLAFKKDGKSEEEFRKFLENCAVDQNRQFNPSLFLVELAQIAKSVSKWVWGRFTDGRFSAIQSKRAKRRWAKEPLSLESQKPWEAEGICRRTWYQRKAASTP